MKAKDILIQAKHNIQDITRWCREFRALDASGASVEPNDVGACQWCAYGSIGHIVGGERTWEEGSEEDKAMISLAAACQRLYGHGLVSIINDHKGHQAVMEMYDLAITLCEP